MRLLGVDYGEKKIGLAISDENEKFAFPFAVLDNISKKIILDTFKKIIDEEKISKIIIGQSLDFNNKPNPIMKRVDAFKLSLEEKFKIPVEFENETLTTKQAGRKVAKTNSRQRLLVNTANRKIHASAAALILQSYLDKQGNV